VRRASSVGAGDARGDEPHALWYADARVRPATPVSGRAMLARPTPGKMNHWKKFKPKACSVQLKAGDKDSALREVVEQLLKSGALPEQHGEGAVRALFEREKLASTGVGMGVAIPHVKLKGLDSVVCNLCVHHQGLEWAAVDGEPVHILFTVLRPEREGENYKESEHIQMMSWIASLSRTPDFRRFATQAKTKTDLVDLLKEMSAV